jgi:SAM-dependent methyltransferase
MKPGDLGKKYDKIALWWHERHQESNYGLSQIEKAIRYCKNNNTALDVGCGSSGRVIKKLLEKGFIVTGIDVSEKMIEIARSNYDNVSFHVADICNWETSEKYDFIVAWDSIFHLPLSEQGPVITKLCKMLNQDGILVYTFGDAPYGEHESDWHNDKFYYSTIGINENLKVIIDNGCQCKHLELDQYPENHVYVIAKKIE